jgi:hypothetical protein
MLTVKLQIPTAAGFFALNHGHENRLRRLVVHSFASWNRGSSAYVFHNDSTMLGKTYA